MESQVAVSESASVCTTLDRLCVNTLRTMAIDGVEQAKSGHPGMPMGAADMAYVLWTRFLKHNPSDPSWPDRDRFVLSAGHGSMLLYALLHLTGYDLPLTELRRFRQWHSLAPGHPEYGLTPGVEMTTGPLGQGLATAVGMAMAERWLAATFNRPDHLIVDHFTYVIAGDGDMEEGISHEAASFAGHQGLGKLIVMYDDNRITIDGPTSLSFSDNTFMRFEAYGWHVQAVDGHNHTELAQALESARAELGRPSLIMCRTHIGFGSPNKQDSSSAHGAPLGPDEARLTKANLGWPDVPAFHVPPEAALHFKAALTKGRSAQARWEAAFADYARAYPEQADAFECGLSRALPAGWEDALEKVAAADKPQATRNASGAALNALASVVSNLVGGSADLAPSNNTYLKGYPVISRETPAGRNIHFGVREHAMAAILNGLTLHGGLIPYGGTFLVFSDYMRPALRLAALMQIPSIFVFTHDSIGVGEDGPTHQPVEHLMSLRNIPGLMVIRPANAAETSAAWRVALTHRGGPIAMALSRQALPPGVRQSTVEGVARGAYVVRDGEDAILLATGSEVTVALAAAELLAARGIEVRVVSMPSWELFEQQPSEYRESVVPASIRTRVSIEAGITAGWCKYVGDHGVAIGLDHFGASAPAEVVFSEFGLTPEAVVRAVLTQLG